MAEVRYPFLGVHPISTDLAYAALESLLRVGDVGSQAAEAVLWLAAFDKDGTLDPALRAYVFSPAFMGRFLAETRNSGGSRGEDDRVVCPRGFPEALRSYAAGDAEDADLAESNRYSERG